MPKYLVLKGSKRFRGACGAAKKAPYTLKFAFYYSFKKQLFEKITKRFFKPNIAKFLLFISFLRNNVSKISLKFPKMAPPAPNLERFAPKSLPPTPESMGGDRPTNKRRLMGAVPPSPLSKSVPGGQ